MYQVLAESLNFDDKCSQRRKVHTFPVKKWKHRKGAKYYDLYTRKPISLTKPEKSAEGEIKPEVFLPQIC